MNDLAGTLIRAGAELLVPGPRAAPGDGTSTGSGGAFVYEVQPGDSIWTIAKQLGVSRDGLMRNNGIGPDDILSIGQELVVDELAVRE